jgi:uncharacterized protein (TIGR01777 family)
VVISGGTGFIGRLLTMALTERGDDVVVLSRRSRGQMRHCDGLGPRPACFRGSGKVELVSWTPEKHGEWWRAVDGADAVVHLAGAGVFDEAWTPERRDVLRSSRIRSTDLLAQAIARAERKPSVFVSGSASGIYGTSTGDQLLTETDLPGDDFLAQLCVEWEGAAAPAREAGVRVCHPRTGLVLGPSGGMLAKMLPAFRAFVGGPVGTGAQYMGWVHIVDVVRALEHAMDTELSGPFNVTAPEPVTMDTFAQVLGEALGRPSIFRVPPFAVKLAFGDRAEAVLTGQRALPRRLSDSGFAFVFPELGSALADLVAGGN